MILHRHLTTLTVVACYHADAIKCQALLDYLSWSRRVDIQLTLSRIKCIKHWIGSRKDYISIKYGACNILAITVVYLNLALLCNEASWHRVTTSVHHNYSHLFTEYIRCWQRYLNVFSFDKCNMILEIFNWDYKYVLWVDNSFQVGFYALGINWELTILSLLISTEVR